MVINKTVSICGIWNCNMKFVEKLLSKFLPYKVWKKHYYNKKYKEIENSGLGKILQKNIYFRDIHKGGRCFILGNGPSLSKVDVALLKDEITFTVNDLYYKEDFSKINTTYHVFADPYYFTELEGILEKLMEKSNPLGVFIEGSGYKEILQNQLQQKYPIYVYSNGIEIEDIKLVPIDLCKLLPYYCTVVQSAISIASYMGFTEIYLLGCDCTGILNFIDRIQRQEIKNYAYRLPEMELLKQKSNSISCEHMFFEWHHIFKSYRLLNSFMKEKNITIINLTENSILDAIEKGNLSDVIQSS